MSPSMERIKTKLKRFLDEVLKIIFSFYHIEKDALSLLYINERPILEQKSNEYACLIDSCYESIERLSIPSDITRVECNFNSFFEELGLGQKELGVKVKII